MQSYIKSISIGKPYPLGTTVDDDGVNFALFARNPSQITLVLVDHTNGDIIEEIPLDPKVHRTGDIWHVYISNLHLPVLYAYRIHTPKKNPALTDFNRLISDPYAKTLHTPHEWNRREQPYFLQGAVIKEEPFDWEGISHPRHPTRDLVIYEMHVRGFTQHQSSGVKYPGTYLGMIEKIPYLKDLGINAVEFIPIQEFNESANTRIDPKTNKPLCNYWGYSPVNFFAPMKRYTSDTTLDAPIKEWKTLVKELHRNDIEVILDIVFNHTGEDKNGNKFYSFLGIDRSTYYLLIHGKDTNYTGCGNTLNLNHPVMIRFVLDCLHYWVLEMKVDGFRFDLASIMNRDTDGQLLPSSPLIRMLSQDPILMHTKLIAEPWDCAGSYQLGGFFPKKDRWSEWNGKYRDSIRQFIKGDTGSKNEFAARIHGSHKEFAMRSPSASINFVTAHDGFSLNDLVSYNEKHNERNGEKNADGNNHSVSWNCGVEGPTNQPDILGLRKRQKKNFLLALFLSQGVPMLLMGDEYSHPKEGNNNTWCQDNELNWFLWDKLAEEQGFYHFVKTLIHFRHRHPEFLKKTKYSVEDIIWHGTQPFHADWSNSDPFLAFTLVDKKKNQQLHAAFNATNRTLTTQLPAPPDKRVWKLVIDTFAEEPKDCFAEGHEQPLQTDEFVMQAYSSILLKSF